jgi:N-methylhydantoinase A
MPGSLRVASDVGGTFTDSIAFDTQSARFEVSKVPTTPVNRAEGTVAGLVQAISALDATGKDVTYVGHGMTTATNAIIQRTGARVAFITNEGFRDMLEIGRQNRPRLYDHRVVRTPPIAPRELRFTVRGRLDETGREVTPLDELAFDAIADAISAAKVEAVAVCFLHSYANPVHERIAGERLRALLPDTHICLSTELAREFREYERSSTTALNAYLVPIMDAYLGSLESLLRAQDGPMAIAPDVPIMVMEASGGLMTLASARAKPVHTVLSGPAGGVVSAARIAAQAGYNDIITMDMGGTSTDISLIIGGEPQVTTQATLEGMPIRIPVVDINAIGAGGGSIASVDEGGALRVGPMSAEAIPGPACYGHGGTQPTVTDANLVLGRLAASTALGGTMTLDIDAARAVVQASVAAPLDLDITAAAAGVVRVANANMERGIRVVSVERGHDPRGLTLVPFGGAGPLHAVEVAESLGMPRVLVPPAPGILCAMGMLMSDLRHDLVATRLLELESLDAATAINLWQPLVDEATAMLENDRVPDRDRVIDCFADVRYVGQSFELSLLIGEPASLDVVALTSAFHTAHLRKFGHADVAAPVELVNLRVRAIGKRPPFDLPEIEKGDGELAHDAVVNRRPVWFEADNAYADTRVIWREALRAGDTFDGPAIIEEISSTTVVRPQDSVTVDNIGNLVITLGIAGHEFES